MARPEYLTSGDVARLFPVLATTSKEGRTTSIVLSCLAQVDEFAREILLNFDQRYGARSVIECYTEVTFKGGTSKVGDRPDGLIILNVGSRTWRALIETKVGKSKLDADQIEKYRVLAKDHDIDCVVTISNDFVNSPKNHPLDAVRRSRSKIPVYHLSWMAILTIADLLLTNNAVADDDQRFLLNELRRFLAHESAGVSGFDRMPSEWSELNKQISAGVKTPARSPIAIAVLEAWHQECRDLTLILSRQTETTVTEKLSRHHVSDPDRRVRDEIEVLRETDQLTSTLNILNAAAPLEIVADLRRRTIEVGMRLKAPEDKKSSKARLNWLLRQIRSEENPELMVRCNWPGRSEATIFDAQSLIENPAAIETDKGHLQVSSFDVVLSKRTGGRFTQQSNFIVDLEDVVPAFYRDIGQSLTAWKKSAPKIKTDRETASEVSVEALEEDANAF